MWVGPIVILSASSGSAAAGAQIGEALGGPLLGVSVVAAGLLTYFQKLPGTKRQPAKATLDLSVIEKLQALQKLKEQGIITEEEFQIQKSKLL
jgi:hypothetical protein